MGTRRVVLVHGWQSSPDDCWFPWLRGELLARGFTVIAPAFPNPREPDSALWVHTLTGAVGEADCNTHFIGHSLGGFIVLKYLEGLSPGSRVGGVLAVASPISVKEGIFGIREELVRDVAQEITALFSDDDYYIPVRTAEEWRDSLYANTIVLPKHGHFSRRERMTELPLVLELILKMSGVTRLPDRAGAALLRDGKVLLVRRLWDGREYYTFPGGGVEHGEGPRQAIEREIKEELQLTITARAPFLEIVNLGRRETFFLIRDARGEPVKSAELLDTKERGTHDLVWFTYDECAKVPAFYPERARRMFLAELGGV